MKHYPLLALLAITGALNVQTVIAKTVPMKNALLTLTREFGTPNNWVYKIHNQVKSGGKVITSHPQKVDTVTIIGFDDQGYNVSIKIFKPMTSNPSEYQEIAQIDLVKNGVSQGLEGGSILLNKNAVPQIKRSPAQKQLMDARAKAQKRI